MHEKRNSLTYEDYFLLFFLFILEMFRDPYQCSEMLNIEQQQVQNSKPQNFSKIKKHMDNVTILTLHIRKVCLKDYGFYLRL